MLVTGMGSDHQLLRAVAVHSAMGAVLGTIFFAAMLIADMFGIRGMIANAELPLTTCVISGIVIISHFAFGAGLTGFLFVLSEGVPNKKRRRF